MSCPKNTPIRKRCPDVAFIGRSKEYRSTGITDLGSFMHNIINEFRLLFFHCRLGLRNKYSLYRGFSFWLFTCVYSLIRHFSKVAMLLKCLSYKKGSGFVTSFVYPETQSTNDFTIFVCIVQSIFVL